MSKSEYQLNITRASTALGAHVTGIDLSDRLSNEQAAALYSALLDHHVLVFEEQTLSPKAQLSFARVFGEPVPYPFIEGLAEAPEVIDIVKTESDTINFGGSWHSDTAYMPEPAMGTVLQAMEVPKIGGDTLFANTAAAYAALSSGMQNTLAGLIGVNSSDVGYGGSRARAMTHLDAMKNTYNNDAHAFESEHPIVRTHPQSGLKGLYVSRSHTARFKDMTIAESKPLLDFLADHIAKPEFTWRLRWRKGTVVIWDNRITQHYALNDYAGQRRHMRRVTIKGDRPH